MKLFDSQERFIQQWNKFFLLCSMAALSLDPLFLYVPVVNGAHKCLDMDRDLAIVVCVLRSFADILYVFHIIFQLRTADVHRCSHIRGYYMAKRYRTSYVIIVDVLMALPLPQLAVLIIIPNLDGPTSFSKESLLKFIIFCQYVPRVIQTSLFHQKVTKFYGFLIGKGWAGAAFNFYLYVLASYVVGALWYLFAIETELRCWHIACQRHNCHSTYFYCGRGHVGDYGFLNASCPLLERNEIKDSTNFDFGIFLDALQTRVLETRDVRQKILYCSLWGLQSLSSLGQGLNSSTFYGELLFAYFIVVTGLVLYASLFGNMQKYFQSSSNLSLRMEDMKYKRREDEDFMSKMCFPEELRHRVRRQKQLQWKSTNGVDYTSFVRDLPRDLRRDINRYLFFPLLKKVPTFEQLGKQLLDAIFDSLKQAPYSENTCLVRKGDPVHEMLFISRGEVRSHGVWTVEFCGEELLTWAIDPKRQQRPFSTRTVKARTDVEAYALVADDLLRIVSQFRKSHAQQLQNTYRFYFEQRMTWAAGYIQSAWRRHCKWKQCAKKWEEDTKRMQDALATGGTKISPLSFVASVYASKFSSSLLCILKRRKLMIQKPSQPKYDEDVATPKLKHMRPLRVNI